MKALAKAGRLRGFRQDRTRRHNRCAEIKANESTIKAAAASPVLESLSLTLGSKVKQGLEVLDGNTSLKTLAIFMEGFTALNLPAKLPELKVLRIKTSEWAGFDWLPQRFARCDYPKLEEIVIDDGARPGGNSRAKFMSMEFLDYLRRKFPACTIKLTKTYLYEEETEMREAFRRWGPPRVGGDFWEYAPVTEQNPLVLPGMEEPDNPAAPFWPHLYGEYLDLCEDQGPLGD